MSKYVFSLLNDHKPNSASHSSAFQMPKNSEDSTAARLLLQVKGVPESKVQDQAQASLSVPLPTQFTLILISKGKNEQVSNTKLKSHLVC